MQSQALLVALCLSSSNALQLSRRDLAKAIGIGAATLAPVANAADIKACPKGANNCWSTASTDKTSLKPWTFPGKKADAVKQLRAALEAYPQAGSEQGRGDRVVIVAGPGVAVNTGQNKVDKAAGPSPSTSSTSRATRGSSTSRASGTWRSTSTGTSRSLMIWRCSSAATA